MVSRQAMCSAGNISIRIVLAWWVACSFSASANAQTVSGLVSSWSFEESGGLTALDPVGQNNGMLVNAVTRTADGRQGAAVDFSGIDNYVAVPDARSLEARSFSVSVWIKRNGGQGDWAKVLSKGDPNVAPWGSYKLEFAGASDDTINWHIGFTDGSNLTVHNVRPIPSGTWTHVVGVFSGSQLAIYLDGTLEQTKSVRGRKTIFLDSAPLTFGGRASLSSFSGDIDEVQYYNRALTSSDVQQIFKYRLIRSEPTLTHVIFQPTIAEFPNPERGFYSWTDLGWQDYSSVRSQGNSLTRQYFRMDKYRDTPLPSSFLDDVNAAFNLARRAGLKIIPRFTYNWGPYPNPEPDATVDRIQQHLQQLAPILAANEDVISSLEAGFIGAFGEWHTSVNGLDTDPVAKAAVLSSILRALPASRMVALRYPSDIELLNGSPIDLNEAFSGSDHARIGSHQDCFLASDTDWGTWGRSGNSYDYDKAYIAANGQYAVVGGETCNVNPPRSSCPTALYELEYMHWSYLNLEYEPSVIQGFKDGGCFDEIRRRLGYRFELASATYSSSVQPGTMLQLDFEVTNVGFASMFNERPVFAVLSNGSSRYIAPLKTDPRRWSPGATTSVSETVALPSTLAAGTYTLSLWLPDKASAIRNKPSYAVRFANVGMWDATAGYNVIANDLIVAP
jgi:hypothetical protein